MAYCPKCGTDIGFAKQCSNCGYSINDGYGQQAPPPPHYQAPPPQYQTPSPYQAPPQQYYQQSTMYQRAENQGLLTAALVLMIIGTIAMAALTYGIALAWCIPMTVHTGKIRNGTKPNTTGFGVCCLLFVGVIAGILLLVAKKD